jgi:predicted MFS family arabinose efflux permease
LANRNARTYIAGQALSLIGDNALWLAMAIWVKILTGSNSAAGLTYLAFLCGLLLAPAGGVVADRLRRRPLLIGANLANAALVCLLLLAGHGQVWLIYLVLFGYGAAGAMIMSAQTALLAVMLPEDLLGEANSLLQVAEVGLRIITPLIGAGLLAWLGPAPVILLDAGTFVAAAVATFALRLPETRPVPSGEPWHAELTAGLRHVTRTRVLRRLLITALSALLVFGFLQVVPFAVVAQGLHRTPPFLGVLECVLGAGAVAGGLAAAEIMRRTSERVLVVGALFACALGSLMLTSSSLSLVLPAMALVGLAVVWANVAIYTLIQRHTPQSLIGRVDAALTVAIVVPQAISLALGASLIAVVNYRLLLIIMAAVFLLSAVPMLGADDVAQESTLDTTTV